MPTPNATLLASVNGGAPATGGITAAAGDTVQFSFLNTAGWRNSCRLELSFPDGFALPAGWSSETVGGHTVYYVLGNTTPPAITLGPWGKYMPRLIVNGGVATDESTAISVPSPGGLLDLGHREAGQFGGSAEGWAADQRANLRTIASGLGSGGDVDPTPDTLTLRGSAGEVRAVRIEAPIVRASSGSAVDFQFGSTTRARLLFGVTCSQAGDFRFDPTTGQMYTWRQGAGEVALSADAKITYSKDRADDAAGDDTVELVISAPLGRSWGLASASFTPSDFLASDNTDYATLTVGAWDSAGNYIGDLAVGATTATGTNSTNDWTAFVPVPLTVQPGALSLPVSATDVLTFRIVKSNAGRIVPPGVLTVVTKTFGS
jgi:hypothetical protein